LRQQHRQRGGPAEKPLNSFQAVFSRFEPLSPAILPHLLARFGPGQARAREIF